MSGSSLTGLVVGGFIAGGMTLFFFFVRMYFVRMLSDIAEVKGSMEMMRRDLHDTREEMIIARSEVKAIWRTLDGPKRSSDKGERYG